MTMTKKSAAKKASAKKSAAKKAPAKKATVKKTPAKKAAPAAVKKTAPVKKAVAKKVTPPNKESSMSKDLKVGDDVFVGVHPASNGGSDVAYGKVVKDEADGVVNLQVFLDGEQNNYLRGVPVQAKEPKDSDKEQGDGETTSDVKVRTRVCWPAK
jgi:hypothetical protein